MPISMKKAATTALAGAALSLAGCATPVTPYQPASAANPVAGGYSDTRIAADRYLVTFSGNSFTSRERVEAALLYRAAELTVQQGYDWFVIHDREMERQVEREVRRDPLYDPWFVRDLGLWRPYWRYYGPRSGWQSWYPYDGDRFWTSHVDVRTIERFEATAEIIMGRGRKPGDNVRAFDAREVMTRLGPEVLHPSR